MCRVDKCEKLFDYLFVFVVDLNDVVVQRLVRCNLIVFNYFFIDIIEIRKPYCQFFVFVRVITVFLVNVLVLKLTANAQVGKIMHILVRLIVMIVKR